MVSNKQLIANKKNSLRGGVKTTRGKEISKYNALRHGLLRQTLTAYEKEAFHKIYVDFIKQYEPVTIFEKILVERATIYYLKLFRLQKAEQEYMNSQLDPRVFENGGDIKDIFKGEVIHEGYTPQITDTNIQKLTDVYARYEITLENRLYKAIHELELAIAKRNGERVPTLNIFQMKMGSFRKNALNTLT